MDNEVETRIADLSSQISQAYSLMDLGQNSVVMVPLRKANEALCGLLADNVGLSKEERDRKYLFGAVLLDRDELKQNYDKQLLNRLREINRKTRGFAHYQSKANMEELNRTFHDDVHFVISELGNIIRENIDPQFEIKRLQYDSISKIAKQKGKQKFEETLKLRFSLGEGEEFDKQVMELQKGTFASSPRIPNWGEKGQKQIHELLESIDYSNLLDEASPSREVLLLLLNSGEEKLIKKVGKIAKENKMHDLQFAAYYSMGRFFGKRSDDDLLLKWMKKCIAYSEELNEEDYSNLYNEILIRAVFLVDRVYGTRGRWKRSEKLLEPHTENLEMYGELDAKANFYYRLANTKNMLNQPRNALPYSQRSLHLARQTGYHEGEALALFTQAHISRKLGDREMSIALLKDAKEIAEANDLIDLIHDISLIEGNWSQSQTNHRRGRLHW